MRVVCRTRSLDSYSEEWLIKRFGQRVYIPQIQELLSVGREYTVYGIVFWDNVPWYYLCLDTDDTYPTPFALEFFEVIDERLSQYWKLSVFFYEHAREPMTSLVFEEWAKEPAFYERLVDGDLDAERVFVRYRQLMDRE